MQERIDHHNAMYSYLVARARAKLDELCGAGAHRRVVFIGQAHDLVGPVYDSLQLRILGADGSLSPLELPGLSAFLQEMRGRKHSITKFADPANARNFNSWQYLRQEDIRTEALRQTVRVLANVCDLP